MGVEPRMLILRPCLCMWLWKSMSGVPGLVGGLDSGDDVSMFLCVFLALVMSPELAEYSLGGACLLTALGVIATSCLEAEWEATGRPCGDTLLRVWKGCSSQRLVVRGALLAHLGGSVWGLL